MDWIAEKIFELFQDILKGDFTKLNQLPALLILITIVGCILARKRIWAILTEAVNNMIKYLNVRRLEKNLESKIKRLAKVVSQIESNIQKVERYKKDFQTTKKETLEKVADLSPPLNAQDQQTLTAKITFLDDRYRSSVEMVYDIQDLIYSINEISRGIYLNKHASSIADDLVKQAALEQSTRQDESGED
jgi:hypothetical protein